MNHPSLFVLVDPDPKGLETLAYAFKRDGCAIASTSNPKLAPEMVRSNSARLVVVSVRAPESASLDLISGLHMHPETKNLPIVALGPVALRPAALAAGAFDFLNTPLFVRDVISIARLVLLMREAAAEKNPALLLRAPLSDYHGLYYLVRAMAGTGRSGILQLVRNNHKGHKGEVRFCDGAVTSAETGSLQGFPALHQLLLWDEGSISLRLRDVARRGQFSLSASDVLDECQRFLRDFSHAATDLGWPRTIYAPDEKRGALPANMVPSEVGPVARLFDGQRTLGDVIEESPFRVFDTLRIVKRLVDFGALVARADAAPAAPRERTKTAAQGSRLVTPPVGVPAAANRRSVVGDRRKSSKQRLSVVERPAAAPAPIPLLVRKSLSPPTGIVAGEISPRAAQRPAHEARQPVAGDGPTVQVRLDGPRMSLDMPATFLGKTPPPVRARASSGPSLERPARTNKKGGQGGLTPTPVFDAIESDFFAREADLYKREAAETFDDLEQGQAPQLRPGRLAAVRSPGGAHKKK